MGGYLEERLADMAIEEAEGLERASEHLVGASVLALRDILRRRVAGYDPKDRKGFIEIFSGLVRLAGFMDRKDAFLRELSSRCSTCPGTVSRWQHGHAAPPAVSRPIVLQESLRILSGK